MYGKTAPSRLLRKLAGWPGASHRQLRWCLPPLCFWKTKAINSGGTGAGPRNSLNLFVQAFMLTHGVLAANYYAIRIVDDTVTNSVSQRRVAELLMPSGNLKL